MHVKQYCLNLQRADNADIFLVGRTRRRRPIYASRQQSQFIVVAVKQEIHKNNNFFYNTRLQNFFPTDGTFLNIFSLGMSFGLSFRKLQIQYGIKMMNPVFIPHGNLRQEAVTPCFAHRCKISVVDAFFASFYTCQHL